MAAGFFSLGTKTGTVTTPGNRSEGVTIRPAERSDLLDVARIERASFSQPWPFQAFGQFLGESGFLVAVEGDAVLGYVVSDTVSPYGSPIGHVKDIAVSEDHRGRGIGRKLLERALSTLESKGAARTKLEVRASNRPAISLYEEYGFSPHHRVEGYYDDGEDAVVYVTDLDG